MEVTRESFAVTGVSEVE